MPDRHAAAEHRTTRSPAARTRPRPGTYVEEATLHGRPRVTSGCAGLEGIEYRVNSDDDATGSRTTHRSTFDRRRVHDRVPRDRRARTTSPRSRRDVRRPRDQRHDSADGRRPRSRARRTSAATSSAPRTLTITATDDATLDRLDRVPRQPAAVADGDLRGDELSRSSRSRSPSPASTTSTTARPTRSATSPTPRRSRSRSATPLHARPLGRVRRHALDAQLAAPHAQRRHAHRRRRSRRRSPDGQLTMPTHDFEIDAADGDDLGRPGQLPRPGPARAGRRAGPSRRSSPSSTPAAGRTSGLMVWNGGQQLLPLHDHPQPQRHGAIYVEQSKDNPTTTEGARVQAGGNVNLLDDAGAGHDPDALHARGGREHRRGAVPGRRAGRASRTPTGSNFPAQRHVDRLGRPQPGGRRAA